MKFLASAEPKVVSFAYPNGPQTNQGLRRYDNVAQYGINSNPATGAIIFEIPLGFNNHMQVHNFTGYDYTSQGGGWQCRVSFYARNIPSVTYPTVTYDTISNSSPGNIHPQVRVGRRISTGNPVIIFGDTTSSWAYPKLMLTSSYVAYQTPTATQFDNMVDPILEATSMAAYDLVVSCFDTSIAGPNDTVMRAAGTATLGGAGYGTGTSLAYTAAGTAKQVLASNGAAAPSWQTLDLTYLPDAWVKKAVRLATTTNLTLSGTPTIDGVPSAVGNRVLVKNQTAPAQNGIYDVAAGAWARSAGSNAATEIAGGTVSVDEGGQAGLLFTTSFRSTDTLGTTAMNWYTIIDTNATDVLVSGRSVGRGGLAGGYAQIVANSANTNATATAVDIAGLATTVTVTATRRVQITVLLHVQSTVANDRAQIQIREGTTVLGTVNMPQLVTAASPYSHQFSVVVNAPAAGAHTYKVSFLRLAGTGTLTAAASATMPAFILAQDLGPST